MQNIHEIKKSYICDHSFHNRCYEPLNTYIVNLFETNVTIVHGSERKEMHTAKSKLSVQIMSEH